MVAHAHDQVHVVLHHDERAPAGPQLQKEPAEARGFHVVHSGGGLIQEDQPRMHRQRPGDLDFPLITVGQGAGLSAAFPGRFVKYAVRLARQDGRRVGYIRPISLWPFPSAAVAEAAERAKVVAVFELNSGQMIEDVQLAVLGRAPVVAIGGISHDHSGFGVGPLLDVEYILKRIQDVYPRRGFTG